MLNLEEAICATELQGYSILFLQQKVGWDPGSKCKKCVCSELYWHRKPVYPKLGGVGLPPELFQKIYTTLLVVLERRFI